MAAISPSDTHQDGNAFPTKLSKCVVCFLIQYENRGEGLFSYFLFIIISISKATPQ